jgi:drug/metabolite transporter (DMT)-like permease
VNQGLFLYGMTLTTPGHAALLYALAPVFVFLLARWRLGERASRLELAGVALALAGVVVVLAGRGAIGGAADAARGLRGDLVVLAAVVAWSFYGVAAKPYAERHGALASAGAALTAGCAASLPIGLALSRAESFQHASRGAWGSLLYLALLSSVAGYVLYVWALRHAQAGRVAIWSNTQPVLTAALSWAVFGEPVTRTFVLGGAMVVAGVVMTERG